jgi:hypothetical protein
MGFMVGSIYDRRREGEKGCKQEQGSEQEGECQEAGEAGEDDLAAVGTVELGTGGHFSLVGGIKTLAGIPPGAGAIDVGAHFGGADGFHMEAV